MNDRFLEELKDRIDIVELIRKYAEVKKSGKNFMAKSPFRNEKTPSFSISPDKQVWYDFGASEGGDAISFNEKIEKVSFQEAIEILADMAGLKIPKKIEKLQTSKKDKSNITDLHAKASEYFTQQLQNHKPSLEYLKSRNIEANIINHWKLGYGGTEQDGLSKYLLKSGFSETQITQSGVAFEREFGDKKIRDRFFSRLIIPIHEPRNGAIIAFGGRDLSGEKKVAKYVNSPENPVYHKSATLFGLEKAKKPIQEQDKVILVEGYFDVISAHKIGLTNTIASCGTALTEDHLRVLKRLTKNIYLAFDSDLAGKKATLRSVEICLNAELIPFIVDIKGGKDFDELVKKDNQTLKKIVENAELALDFLLVRFSKKFLNGTIGGEKKLLDSFFFFLRLVNSPLEIDHYLGSVAQKVNRSKSLIESEFKRFVSKNTKSTKPKFVPPNKIGFTLEENFVGLVCAFWDKFKGLISEATLDLLTEEQPKSLLTKKFHRTKYSQEESLIVAGWEIYQENLYKDCVTEEVIIRDYDILARRLQDIRAKKERIKHAEELRSKFLVDK